VTLKIEDRAISPKSVQFADKVAASGDAELIEEVKNNRKTVSAAYKEIREREKAANLS
jgi:hypothetical protein